MSVFDILTPIAQFLPVFPDAHIEYSVEQGILAGIIFLLGAISIYFLPKWKWAAATLLLIGITPFAIGGFWFSPGPLGISDWDYYFSLHTSHRNTIVNYHELPHWNVYTCGGTAGIADPEFRFFTPTFLTQLALGIPTGFRIAIFLATATGAIGMLFLGKRLGLSVHGALLAAIAVAFGSVNLLEIVEGHPNIFSAMWIPWIFWSWLGAYRYISHKSKFSWFNPWALVCGVFLALTFFEGGIYLLMYTAIAFAGLLVLAPSKKKSFYVSLQAGLWSLGLAAIKIIPVLLWLRQFQDKMYAGSKFTLPYLDEILLGRYIHNAGDIIPNQGSGWHEYGAYIGYTVLILAFIGLWYQRRTRIAKVLCIAALLSILVSSLGPYLEPLFDSAPFLPRSNISRFILFGVIPLSLLAGYGIDAITTSHWLKRLPYRQVFQYLVAFLLIGSAAIELMSLSYPLSLQAFVLPHTEIPPEHAPYPLAYTAFTYEVRHDNNDYTRAYEAASRGYGTMSYCSVLTPDPLVRTIHDEEDNGIISLQTSAPDRGTYELISWTPNRVEVKVSVPNPTEVILNTNFAKGWMVNGQAAEGINGRVGTSVPPGDHHLTFSFYTPGFNLGAFISAITVLFAIIFSFLRHKARSLSN